MKNHRNLLLAVLIGGIVGMGARILIGDTLDLSGYITSGTKMDIKSTALLVTNVNTAGMAEAITGYVGRATSATGYVNTNDYRLTNSRPPEAHTQSWITITGAPAFYPLSNPSNYVTIADVPASAFRLMVASNILMTVDTNGVVDLWRISTNIIFGMTFSEDFGYGNLLERPPVRNWPFSYTNQWDGSPTYGGHILNGPEDSMWVGSWVSLDPEVLYPSTLYSSGADSYGYVTLGYYTEPVTNHLYRLASTNDLATYASMTNIAASVSASQIAAIPPVTVASIGALSATDVSVTNARVPLAHSQPYTSITDAPAFYPLSNPSNYVTIADVPASAFRLMVASNILMTVDTNGVVDLWRISTNIIFGMTFSEDFGYGNLLERPPVRNWPFSYTNQWDGSPTYGGHILNGPEDSMWVGSWVSLDPEVLYPSTLYSSGADSYGYVTLGYYTEPVTNHLYRLASMNDLATYAAMTNNAQDRIDAWWADVEPTMLTAQEFDEHMIPAVNPNPHTQYPLTSVITTNQTVDAGKLGGYTIDEVMAVGSTYFFGTNVVNYGAVTGRIATIEVPLVGGFVTYAGPVTSGQYIASYLIPSNQMPALIPKGTKATFSFHGGHAGTPSQNPTIMGDFYILNATNASPVQEFESPVVIVPRGEADFDLEITFTNDIVKDGYAFLMRTKIVDDDGYSGDYTSYYGKPYFTGFNFPKATGVFTPQYVHDADMLLKVDKAGGTASNLTVTGTLTVPAPINSTDAASVGWVSGLFSGNTLLYTTANASPFYATNFIFSTTMPVTSFVRSYTNPPIGGYIGHVITTQRFTNITSPMTVNAYLRLESSAAGRSINVHPEFYYSYDGTNFLGDYESEYKTVSSTATNLFQWVIPFPTIIATNTQGVYVERRFKVDGKTSSPNIQILGGDGTASYIGLSTPAASPSSVDMSSVTNVARNTAYNNTNYYQNSVGGNVASMFVTPTTNLQIRTGNNTGIVVAQDGRVGIGAQPTTGYALTTGDLIPSANNINYLGSSGARWYIVYSGGGGFNTTGPIVGESVKATPAAAFPAHAAGILFYHSASNHLYVSNGSVWVQVDN